MSFYFLEVHKNNINCIPKEKYLKYTGVCCFLNKMFEYASVGGLFLSK
ncbi:MAG: hypothetical protein LBK29_01685 [Oscillospiraceae bacterium]|nr:hypothetical protein [Oscillospiraceae bacterium]